MILNYSYYFWRQALDADLCNKIINHGNSLKEEVGRTGGNVKDLTDDQKKKLISGHRNSNVAWIDEQWLYDILNPYVAEANKKAGWNYEYDFVEPIQFTKYKLNQYYNWHCDSDFQVMDRPNDPNLHGRIRKLSAIVLLSDRSDYVGGELKFDIRNNPEGCNIIDVNETTKGSIIVFPSFIWHKVYPVTWGNRYSLVAWYIGRPFK